MLENPGEVERLSRILYSARAFEKRAMLAEATDAYRQLRRELGIVGQPDIKTSDTAANRILRIARGRLKAQERGLVKDAEVEWGQERGTIEKVFEDGHVLLRVPNRKPPLVRLHPVSVIVIKKK